MRKMLGAILGLTLAVAASPGFAADIGNLSGQSCGDFSGTWHFVNNQSGTTTPGTLTATWSSGESCVNVAPVKVTPNGTQHFYCQASGTLTGASTTLSGKLVLSDFACQTKCDPKTDPKCGQ